MIVAAESSAGKERKDRIAVVTGFGHCSVGVAGSDSVCYLLHAVKNRIGYRIRKLKKSKSKRQKKRRGIENKEKRVSQRKKN